jgi:CRISPR-associated protein Csy1
MENVMLKEVTETFLLNRKTQWLDKQTKGKTVQADKLESLQLEADERYNIDTWVAKAIKQARPSITTHPSTFTHSDAKTTALKFTGNPLNDGLVKTGNVAIEQNFDVFGNAATDTVVWDTYVFLNTVDKNGLNVLEHFQTESQASKDFIQLLGLNYDEARSQFIKIFEPPTSYKTSGLLKQVYFPIDSNYHLLSLLTSSTLAYEMKRRIFSARFSESTKQAKEKRKQGEFDENGFDDYLNLTVLGLGGTKPQNVSSLNIKNNGQL